MIKSLDNKAKANPSKYTHKNDILVRMTKLKPDQANTVYAHVSGRKFVNIILLNLFYTICKISLIISRCLASFENRKIWWYIDVIWIFFLVSVFFFKYYNRLFHSHLKITNPEYDFWYYKTKCDISMKKKKSCQSTVPPGKVVGFDSIRWQTNDSSNDIISGNVYYKTLTKVRFF